MTTEEKLEQLKEKEEALRELLFFEKQKQKEQYNIEKYYTNWCKTRDSFLKAINHYLVQLKGQKGVEIIEDCYKVDFKDTPKISKYIDDEYVVVWEGEEVKDSYTYPKIAYRGVQIRISTDRKGDAKLEVDLDSTYGKAYKKVSTVMKKIDEYVEEKLKEEKQKNLENAVYDKVVKKLQEKYPDFNIFREKKVKYLSNKWHEFQYIKIELPNGSYVYIGVNYNENIFISQYKNANTENVSLEALLEVIK